MKLTVIAGPTASGKTALAIELAQRSGAEIVSADSQQVYRYFDLGTAKPTPQEMAAVPHHLISIVEPMDTGFSAARYGQLADQAIAEIGSRGRPVIVVGGTGLYLRVLLHGVVAAPSRDDALRAELEAFADRDGDEALHARLAAVDPLTAAQHPVQDRLRVIRALEIFMLTGTTASAHRQAHSFAADRYEYDLIVLSPEREALYEVINRRTQSMFAGGLIDETRALLDRGFRSSAPMRSVGYVQALQVIDGSLNEAQAIADTAQASRHYAKRQTTWFKKEKGARFMTLEQARSELR